jgi:ferredoxin-NAD(P)+ reductase (naphthalene dioxygenase ferredoxin-specific)
MDLIIKPLAQTLQVRAGANLLEVLLDHGVPVSYSCMSGRCGTCRCKLVSGEVLSAGQESSGPITVRNGEILACQTSLASDCVIEIAEPDEIVVHPARTAKAVVTGVEDLTHDIKRLVLRPARPIAFSPGQYAILQFANGLQRPYSMAGVADTELLEFHIRLVPGGRVTTYIGETLKVGDAVRVSGPMGSSYLRSKHAGPVLCIAGGTGLAPVLSILRGATCAGMSNPTHVYVGARSPRDVYGIEWLRELTDRNPSLRIHVVTDVRSASSGFRTGLVTEAVAADWPSLAGFRAYVCGAPPMVEAAALLLRQRGVAEQHIHADAFYASGV